MALNSYDMLFTDQNPNREFIIQPYTTNGPATPDGGVDPSASTASTTLFLYGKGAPNYGDRIQENLVFMLEHFFSPIAPSFPIPGQVWFASSSNEITTPYQLQVFNPRKFIIISNSGNLINIQSDDGSLNASAVQSYFNTVFTETKTFTVYSPTYVQLNFTQIIAPSISGPNVVLTVTPTTPAATMAGSFIGGWEEIYQGSCEIVLRRDFNANGYFLQNLPNPVNPNDAANKAYVDAAAFGGTIYLYNLGDVDPSLAAAPNGSFFQYNGGMGKWTYTPLASMPFLLLAGGTMSGAINMGGQLINNLATPVSVLDAVNKNYVDGQPLSGANVTITAPANQNVLSFNSGTLKWVNLTPTAAGLLPLSGGAMTGAINMSGHALTGLPTPVNPSDAVPLSYLSAGGSVITSATYNNITGTLTINQTGLPNTIAVSGFYPIQSSNVTYLPPDPATVTAATSLFPGEFFQSTLATTPIQIINPNVFVDPTNVLVNPALAALDVSLGNFAAPRQRIVFPGNGTSTYFNLNTGAPLGTYLALTTPPELQYVTGSGNLAVYINGIKQIPSDFAFYSVTSINTTTLYAGVTLNTGTSTLVIPGNQLRTFRPNVIFSVSGTLTTNDGSYIVLASSLVGLNTQVTVTPNTFALTPGIVPFVASGTGTVTYGPFDLLPGMETGYNFGGPSNPQSLQVTVNGLSSVTVTINTATTNCNNFGLLANAVSTYAANYYINPIVSATAAALGPFVVSGNRVSQFTPGTTFTVRNSTGNDGVYTVLSTLPYNPITNLTTIYVNETVPYTLSNGIIFQDNWGFSMAIEGGTIVFYSNIAGSTSSVVPVDMGLLSSVTGITWPVTISPSLIGTTNPLAPADYSYVEYGIHGHLSSLIQFAVAPLPNPSGDVVEIVIDREVIYNNFNPYLTAVTV